MDEPFVVISPKCELVHRVGVARRGFAAPFGALLGLSFLLPPPFFVAFAAALRPTTGIAAAVRDGGAGTRRSHPLATCHGRVL